MNDKKIEERPDSISFCEVCFFSFSSKRFYPLFRGDNPTSFVYSESHLR